MSWNALQKLIGIPPASYVLSTSPKIPRHLNHEKHEKHEKNQILTKFNISENL
jgi:hypothetical protein